MATNDEIKSMAEIVRLFDELGFHIEAYQSIESRRIAITFVIEGTMQQAQDKKQEFIQSIYKNYFNDWLIIPPAI